MSKLENKCQLQNAKPLAFLDLKISLSHLKSKVNKEDNEIQKIVRLGKEIDEKNRTIDQMKIDQNKLQRKYEIEMQNVRSLKHRVEDLEYEVKRFKPTEISDDIASSNTKTKEGSIIESSSKIKLKPNVSSDSLFMKKSRLMDKLIGLK